MKTISKIALLTASLAASSATWAAGTAAGSVISNTATATFTDPNNNNTGTVSATAADIVVAELINVNVSAQNAEPVEVQPGVVNQVLEFKITNTGNGSEDYTLTAENLVNDGFDTENVKIYLDTNGDGTFDATDELVNSDIVLAADESVTVFIVGDIPNTAATGENSNLTLAATSATPGAANATPGTLLAGQGTNTSAGAVVGESVTDSANGGFVVGAQAVNASVDLSKTIESRVDPFGGTTDVPGTVVTYLITATAVNGDVDNLTIVDSVPPELELRADSVTINGDSKTAAADGDEVVVVLNEVVVTLGRVTSNTTFEIRLDAEIK